MIRNARVPAQKKNEKQEKKVVLKYTLGIKPKTEEEWIALSNDMLEFVEHESVLDSAEFPLSRNYSPHRFYKWVKESEYFAECLEIAKYRISLRRCRAVNEKRFDSQVYLKTLPLYDIEFKEHVMAKIKMHQESRPTEITVMLDSIQVAKHNVLENK